MNNNISVPTLEEIHSIYRQITLKLIEKGCCITTMESCTSGFIASLITDTEGSSSVFKGSFVTYSNEAKIKCGVKESVIADFGVYSTQTAESMAEAAAAHYDAEISIGVTGTFGNVDPNNSDSVPGKVYVAVKNGANIISKELILPVNITRFESKLCVAKLIADLI